MAYPPTYNRDNDFATYNLPRPSGDSMNQEYDKLAASVNALIGNLSYIQREDLELSNGIVKPHTLSQSVYLLLVEGTSYQGDWESVPLSATDVLVNGDFTEGLSGWTVVFGATHFPPTSCDLLGTSTPDTVRRGEINQQGDWQTDPDPNAVPGVSYAIPVYRLSSSFSNVVNGDGALILLDTGGVGSTLNVPLPGDGSTSVEVYWKPQGAGYANWQLTAQTASDFNNPPSIRLGHVFLHLTRKYYVNDTVTDGSGNLYVCIEVHYAGETLAQDIAAGYWVQLGGQLADQQSYGVTSGTGSAYTATLSAGPALEDGAQIELKWHVESEDNATLNINGTGAIDLLHSDNRAIEHKDLVQDEISILIYQGGKWVVHTNATRRTQIALNSLFNDDTSPASTSAAGAFAYYGMVEGTKVWLPTFRFRPLDPGVSPTPIEVHLEIFPEAAEAGKNVAYKLQAFTADSFAAVQSAAVVEATREVATPDDTASFTIDFELSIPSSIGFTHMSISVERVAPSINTHTASMALYHVEGRL